MITCIRKTPRIVATRLERRVAGKHLHEWAPRTHATRSVTTRELADTAELLKDYGDVLVNQSMAVVCR